MITLTETAAKEALEELSQTIDQSLVLKQGRRWTFLPGALSPGSTLQIDEDGDFAILDLIYVEADRRKKGDARTALAKLLEAFDNQLGGVEVNLIASQTPINKGDLQSTPEEDVLERFYSSFGFTMVGYSDDDKPMMIRRAGGPR